jgi:hypothetical protein|tara:strand:- start:161 stop:334 length:174 start_codon:yes stop_codon:yes gene_type:complete
MTLPGLRMRSLSGTPNQNPHRFTAENLLLFSPFKKFGCQRVAAVLKQTETVVPERFA